MRKPISLGLALLGLFDSLYLLWTYTSPSRPMLCLGTGCDAVRLSVYSHMWGMPMPVFGAAGYATLAILIFAEPLVSGSLAQKIRYALAGLTAPGFLFSLYLEYLQGFVIHAFCAWCVTSGLVMTALCGLAVYDLVHAGGEPTPEARLVVARNQMVVCVGAFLVGVPAFYLLARHSELAPSAPPAPTEALATRLVRPQNHMAGNPQSPVTVVEFGDFECPACGREEPIAREIRARYSNQIRFVFRQFPLTHIHPFSERMAEASECAADQGKFWEMVDKIYSRQSDLSDEGLKRDAAEVGLDQARFTPCLMSGSMAARVGQDLADGKALGVSGTPTFFVGEKRLEDVPSLTELTQLIDQDLASHGMAAGTSVEPSGTALPSERKKPAATAPGTEETPSGKARSQPTPASGGLFGTAPGGIFSSFQGKGVACSEAEAAQKQPALIGNSELRQILNTNPKPLFVDVRPAKEYAAGKIPGAINVPVDDMEQRWSSLPKDRVIVLYESGRSSRDICAASRAAGRILLEHGLPFNQVKVYQDGLAGWEKSESDTNK